MENFFSSKNLTLLVLITALGISYFLTKNEPGSGNSSTYDFGYGYRTKENENKFTRGQIHYLSMDSGMSDCWNNTMKKILLLGCPSISNYKDHNVEMELIFMLTSCFCESIGTHRLTCPINHEKINTTKKYVSTLTKCAKKKCYTKFGHDGYDTVSTRMHELCYFIQEEMKTQTDMIQCCETDELTELRNIVNGDREEEFYPRMKYMDSILYQQILDQQAAKYNWFGFQGFEERFWRIWDDVKFRLRIGNYRNVPRY